MLKSFLLAPLVLTSALFADVSANIGYINSDQTITIYVDSTANISISLFNNDTQQDVVSVPVVAGTSNDPTPPPVDPIDPITAPEPDTFFSEAPPFQLPSFRLEFTSLPAGNYSLHTSTPGRSYNQYVTSNYLSEQFQFNGVQCYDTCAFYVSSSLSHPIVF